MTTPISNLYYHSKSFSEFKENFYSRVPDLSVFNCAEINILKVVLDGLKVKYHSRKDMRGRLEINSNTFTFKFWNIIRSIKSKKSFDTYRLNLKMFASKSVLVGFDRRSYLKNVNRRSVYFDRIIETIGKEKVLFVAFKRNDYFDLESDLSVNEIESFFPHLILSQKAVNFRAEILITLDRIKSLNVFDSNELWDIFYATQQFYYQFLSWDFLFSYLNLKNSVIVAHYHHEGFILACKRNNIKIIELQHGLIASQDIFYLFPDSVRSIAKNALFADKILVYGDYWKYLLSKGNEYEKKQIDTIGYYLSDSIYFSAKEEFHLREITCGKTILLITTQTFLHDIFINYVQKHAYNLKLNEIIILKPHPSEVINCYDCLKGLKNVYVLNYNVNLLLKSCDWHISIFSTTIFDALRFGKKSACIDVEIFSDYIDAVVSLGFARKISFNENPFQIFRGDEVVISENLQGQYFSIYKPDVLIRELT